MLKLTPSILREITGGRWLVAPAGPGGAELPLTGRVGLDSREVTPGDVFWAVQGRQHDGADFVADAFQRGALGAVCRQGSAVRAEGGWVLAVDDPRQALATLAARHRKAFEGTVIAVTGSVGKTTARQMIHTVLAARFTGTASPRNYNNHLGLPLSMLGLSPTDDYAVLELGANRPGEIAELAGLCRPGVAVITRIADAHVGGFGRPGGVAEAKGELLAALPTSGWAVLNGDDAQLCSLGHASPARIEWVGRGTDCDLTATNVHSKAGWLRFEVEGHSLAAPVWGRHHLASALAAVAIGKAWGLGWGEIAEALGGFQPPPMRCQVRSLGAVTVIDDSYNSSPAAMRAALELLRDFDAPGRRIVVSGDMCELGTATDALHQELGQDVVSLCGADLLVACGELADVVVAGARAAGMPAWRTKACGDAAQAVPLVTEMLRPGDVLLVKGSRAVGLDRLVADLSALLERSPSRDSPDRATA